MFKKTFIAAAAAAVLLAPVQRATAGSNDFAAGLVTGIVGTIIVNQSQKNRPKVVHTRPTTTVVVPDSPQRAANRLTQTALNYFNFNAGYADGIFGNQTATAVRGYQSFMNFPVVGKLAPFEHQVLMAAYNRGQAGDYESVQLISTNPLGVRALLLDTRDRMLGVNNNNGVVASTSTFTPNVNVATGGGESTGVVNVANIPDTVITPESTPVAVTPPPSGGGLLPLIPIPTATVDVAANCAEFNSNGLPKITPVSIGDPGDAMEQLFCEARAEVIGESKDLIAGVSGVSADEIIAQCTQLGPVMQPYVASLATKGRSEVLADVNGFVSTTGADPAQLASTAEICLGTGYDIANMDVAAGSALLLAAMGQSGYGELLGHHLFDGVGVGTNEDRAMDWLVWTTDELATGATTVFGDDSRTALLDEAVFRLNGGSPSNAAKNSSTKGKAPAAN